MIDNLEDDYIEMIKALNFPGRSEVGYTVPFSKVCYIEATDFRESDYKDYYGLAPGKSVMLRYLSHIARCSGSLCSHFAFCTLQLHRPRTLS